MLHGYGWVFLFTPLGLLYIGLMMLLCMAAHAISKACAKVPSQALVGCRFRYFPITLISAVIAVGLSFVMIITFALIPWMNAVFSEWGILYENAVPQTIVFYVLWGIAYYFALHIQMRSIMKRFAQEYREMGRTYAKNYFLLSAVFVFLLQFIVCICAVMIEFIQNYA